VDGVIDDALVAISESSNVKSLVADKKEAEYKTKFLKIYTREDLVTV
jgi:hypothetical protein